MPVKFSEITSPRSTRVPVYETGEDGKQREMCLNIRHKRITPILGQEVSRLVNSIAAEQEAYWKAKLKQKEDGEKPAGGEQPEPAEPKMPRSSMVEQLVLLMEYTDILGDAGEIMPPTRETFERLPNSLLLAMLTAINDSAVPEKKSSPTSEDGTPPAEG